MNKIQDILTYEIYVKDSFLYIHIPVSGLINPQYLLKDDCLYIFLYNYTQGFLIKEVPKEFIEYIISGNAYLIESLTYDEQIQHLINLIPN